MDGPASDTLFAGSIPELYDTCLVPLIFEPYAEDLAKRAVALEPSRVLETAAGTGVVTRALASALSSHVELVATDLNQPMIDRAAAVGTRRHRDSRKRSRRGSPPPMLPSATRPRRATAPNRRSRDRARGSSAARNPANRPSR